MGNPSRKSVLRFAFAFSLIAAAAICCTVSYLLISNLERDVGEENYESIAATGLARAQELTLRRIEGLEMTATIMAFAYPNVDDWPMVALNGYSEVAQRVADLSGARAMGLMPFVKPEQVTEFEEHALKIFYNNTFRNYPNGTGEGAFGFGIWKRSKNSPYPDKKMHDTTGETPFPSKYQILAPILEHNWQKSPALMFNIHSEIFRAKGLDSTLDCIYNAVEEGSPDCAAVSDWMELVPFPGEPAGQIYLPIFPANDPTTVVGMVGSTLLWDLDVLGDVFPDNVNGLHCVIATDTNQFTYLINEGVPERLGEGDLHDASFDEYAQSVTLTDFETGAKASATYTLTVYPTNMMFEEYSTGTPLAVCLGFLGVIAFCAVLFMLYDVLIRQESHRRKVILEMKRAFVRFISHEIRTPLNTVCLGLELLQSELADQKKTITAKETMEKVDFLEEVTTDIHENAQSAVSVLNDLLNYDKIESHTLKIETAPVDIWTLVQKVVKSFQIQASNKKVSLDLTIDRGDCDLRVIGDDIRLTQVLRNIISNALKFTPAEGNVKVTAKYLPNGLPDAKPVQLSSSDISQLYLNPRFGSVVISVQDNGEGLSEDQLSELFKEGVQFNVNKLQHGGGSGLGLSIAKGIVEKHSGTITATSEGLGQGTTFIVELPLHGWCDDCGDGFKAQAGAIQKTASTNNSIQKTLSTNNSTQKSLNQGPVQRRILVVEDTASSRKMLVRLLDRAGHTCVTAVNGKEAVDVIAADLEECKSNPKDHTPIDTILMDYEMPIMNGPEATSEIRKIGFQDTIFGVTGNVLSEDVEFFLSSGADDVLGKPISMAALNQKWDLERIWSL